MAEIEHQCPYCELRFAYLTELKDHITHDHRDHVHVAETLDPHELPRGMHGGGTSVGHAHQCPYCELRFSFTNEMKDHMSLDHAGRQDGA